MGDVRVVAATGVEVGTTGGVVALADVGAGVVCTAETAEVG